jgi:DNA-binding HxlR family transcriptional regulator
MVLFDLLGRRWALRILYEMQDGHVGFRSLQGRCEEMSSSVLRERLRELVAAGVVATDDEGRYCLTAAGLNLVEALQPLIRWADSWGSESPPLAGGMVP